MPEISKIKLPGSGQSYDIKDTVARQAIAGGISYVIAWKGDATPVVGNIPAGVVVTYNGMDYTGTLAASATTVGSFYLVKSSNAATNDVYDEYTTVSETVGTTTTYSWERLGTTDVDLSSKQDVLVSGTNIKTINNTSILGSGNLDVDDVFIATYNSTPFADIYAAYTAGKLVICQYDLSMLGYANIPLTSCTAYSAIFTGVVFALKFSGLCLACTSGDVWSTIDFDVDNCKRAVYGTTTYSTIYSDWLDNQSFVYCYYDGDSYVIANKPGADENIEFICSNGTTIKKLTLTSAGVWSHSSSSIGLSKGSGDMVLGEATTFTASSSSISFSGGTTDKVLGSDATFTTTVTPTTTNIKATASGTAVGANGTDTFVKSYPGATSKLATTSITGTNGTDTAHAISDKVSKKLTTTSITGTNGTDTAHAISNKVSKKLTTTSITGTNGTDTAHAISAKVSKKLTTTSVYAPTITSNSPNVPNWSFTMGTGNDAETLIISGGNGTWGSNTVATGGLSETSASANVGGEVVSSFTATEKTLAKVASSATTVATGALSDTTATSNVGGEVVSSFTATEKTLAKVASSATTVATGGLSATTASSNVGGEVVSSFTATEKTLAKVADSATTVATGSLDNNGSGDSVMTGLGTATTGSALTGVKVTSQPTISLSTGATAGTGVISVATGITSATTTTDSKDEVTAVTSVGTGTAAAQSITVGTNDKVKVAKYDDLSVSAS